MKVGCEAGLGFDLAREIALVLRLTFVFRSRDRVRERRSVGDRFRRER